MTMVTSSHTETGPGRHSPPFGGLPEHLHDAMQSRPLVRGKRGEGREGRGGCVSSMTSSGCSVDEVQGYHTYASLATSLTSGSPY